MPLRGQPSSRQGVAPGGTESRSVSRQNGISGLHSPCRPPLSSACRRSPMATSAARLRSRPRLGPESLRPFFLFKTPDQETGQNVYETAAEERTRVGLQKFVDQDSRQVHPDHRLINQGLWGASDAVRIDDFDPDLADIAGQSANLPHVGNLLAVREILSVLREHSNRLSCSSANAETASCQIPLTTQFTTSLQSSSRRQNCRGSRS